MALPRQPHPVSPKWVDRAARQIRDPVHRLRFVRLMAPPIQPARRTHWRRALPMLPLLLLVVPVSLWLWRTGRPAPDADAPVRVAPRHKRPVEVRAGPPPAVWQVERTSTSETYSNGLLIDTRFSSPNRIRSYVAFRADRPEDRTGYRRLQPAGIAFHTTQSRLAPFEAQQNGFLKKIGESLLDYVRRRHSYHYVIDRFGRVHRVVPESDAANHAGYSVWADSRWLYVNLNESFLGVAFEAGTTPGQVEAAINPAQVRAAAMLTDMLRGRYGIPATNCVTHAQISVNPSNMRVGYHTDWASSFPFEQLGLPDNYERTLPALSDFGFDYDARFLRSAGPRMYESVALSEGVIEDGASRARLKIPAYRRMLQKRYREKLAEMKRQDALGTQESE